MKKFIALLLCAALLLPTALSTGAVYAAETPAIVCEDVTCSPGEQVTVEVTVTNNPGFAYLELTPKYAAELSLASVSGRELISDFTKGKQYVWVAEEDVTEDGVLLTLTFDVAETVPAGEYTVDFILRSCFNYDEEPVQFTVHSGTVKVEREAAVNTCGENLTWELDSEGTLTISGTGPMTDYGDVDAPWNSVRETVKKVVINNGVTSIGKSAFSFCALTEAVLPETLTQIGSGAFLECKELKTITIPSSVESIGLWAFYNCSGLSSVVIEDGVEFIDEGVFYGCTSLKDIVIPDSVTTVGTGAFEGCSGLISAEIGSGVTEVGPFLFHGCAGLEEVVLSEGLSEISRGMFDSCSSLKSVVIPDSVTSVGVWAFLDCSNLTTMTIGNGVESVDSLAFAGAGLQTVFFRGNMPGIDEEAFYLVQATCYYPSDNTTWSEEALRNYGGELTWLPAGEIVVEKEDGTTDSYVSLQAAVDAFGGTDKAVVLQSSVTEDITVEQSVVLDLNGCTITGNVTGSGTLTVKDSKTDDFDVEDGEGYGVITGTAENVVPAEGYVKIVENGGTSIHKVDLTIKGMGLRPAEAGLYFKSDFAGDQVVARNVSSFGVALSVAGEPDETTLQNPKHFTRYEKEAFGTGADNTSTLLTGILKEDNGYNTNQRNAKIKVYGRAYIEVDGVTTFGACQSRSLREQLEGIDAEKWAGLEAPQKTGFLNLYARYEQIMRSWALPNLKAELN